MRCISVSNQINFLNEILKQALLEEIILEVDNGQRFVITSIEKWKGFELADDDITQNNNLIEHLSQRRNKDKHVSLSDVKKILNI